MARRRKSISIAEEDAFLMVIDELVDDIMSHSAHEDMHDVHCWIKEMIDYNVPHGKQIRGRGVISAYRSVVKNPSAQELKLIYIVGWCIEMFGACFYMPEDIIRNSETRRGRSCWHLMDHVGNGAINDAFVLNGVFLHILDKHFGTQSYYADLVGLFHDMFYKTSLGQCLDIRGSMEHGPNEFNMENYLRITKYKVSYFSFYMPIAAAWILAGFGGKKQDLNSIEKVVLELGYLFQVQDDYLDCFGDPEVTGKQKGMSIQENRISWFIVQAYEKANSSQLQVLNASYGQGKLEDSTEKIQSVLTVFKELRLPEEYKNYEMSCYNSIMDKINSLPSTVPKVFFEETAEIMIRRNR